MSHEVLAAVRPLLPTIAARSGIADEQRMLPAETIEELVGAGVLGLLRPKRFGGREAHPNEFFDVVRVLAGACGSTGWVASVLGVHPWHVALFDERAQDEVYGDDPETLVCSAYAPVGRLEEVDGGYRLSGHWSFSSGVDHAQWALLGAMLPGPDGPRHATVLVPRTDFRVADVWDVVGLRGTGSNDVHVAGAHVPSYRVLAHDDQQGGRAPGREVNTAALYRLPFASVFTSAITTPVLGAVEGCLETWLTHMRERVRGGVSGGRFADDPFAQVAVARAASDVDAARLQMERNLADLLACAAADEEIPIALRVRARRDQVLGTERALHAVDLLFKTAGGNSLRRGNPIERAWRDAHAGSVHVANDIDRALASYGRHAFGLPVVDTFV